MSQRKEGRYPYPFLECDHHRGRQRAYVICRHAMDSSAAVAKVDLASDETPGWIVCAECAAKPVTRDRASDGTLRCVCEGCAIEKGLLVRNE